MCFTIDNKLTFYVNSTQRSKQSYGAQSRSVDVRDEALSERMHKFYSGVLRPDAEVYKTLHRRNITFNIGFRVATI